MISDPLEKLFSEDPKERSIAAFNLATHNLRDDAFLKMLACLLVERRLVGELINRSMQTTLHQVVCVVLAIFVREHPNLIPFEALNDEVCHFLRFSQEDRRRPPFREKRIPAKKIMREYTRAALRFLRLCGILKDNPEPTPSTPFALGGIREIQNVFHVGVTSAESCRLIKYKETVSIFGVRKDTKNLNAHEAEVLRRMYWLEEPKTVFGVSKKTKPKTAKSSKHPFSVDQKSFSGSDLERYLIYLEEKMDRVQYRYASAIARLDAVEKALNLQRGEG